MPSNRNHKDSVFTALFSNEPALLELYNAIEGTNYGKDTHIEINTLTDVLYMEQMNDISFVIDGRLVVLIEHQSTVNENMPLRMLIYMGRLYEQIVKDENIYKNSRIIVPFPEFIVLYNGKDSQPDYREMFLSEAFEKILNAPKPPLELKVKIYNINKGHNPKILDKRVGANHYSPLLSGYSQFIAEVKENEKTMDREGAIKKAVKDCIRRNILKKFLQKHASEVINMIFTEWNWDDALRVRKEEGIQEGEFQKAQAVARTLLTKGIPLPIIIEATGLSVPEVEALSKGAKAPSRRRVSHSLA